MNLDSSHEAVVQRVLEELTQWESVEGIDRDLFVAFGRETVHKVRGPFLAQHAPRQVVRHLLNTFRFALNRPEEEIHVRMLKGSGKGVFTITHMSDQPFIVDTVRLFFKRHEADYWGGFNVVFRAQRDENGRLIGVGGDTGVMESLAFFEADGMNLVDKLESAQQDLLHRLQLAQLTVSDFGAMTRLVERLIEKSDTLSVTNVEAHQDYEETSAFLKWLLRDNFVFMGAETGEEKYGIQRSDGPYYCDAEGAWTPPHPPGTVHVRKAEVESPIHRAGRVDEILVTLAGGTPRATQLYLRGMFTYRAVTQPSRHVPILRRVLQRILAGQESAPGSYRYKGIANVFDSLPTEFLFTTSQGDIQQMVELVLQSEQQQEVGVTFLTSGANAEDAAGEDSSPWRAAFCLVSMPKSEYSDALRRLLQTEIEGALEATYTDHGTFMGRFDTVLLYFYLTGMKGAHEDVIGELVSRVRTMATPWSSRLWQFMAQRMSEEQADYLVETYGRAFPQSYTRVTPVDRAYADIQMLEALTGEQNVLSDAFVEGDTLALRVYQARDIYLTDILPVLDNFDLTVIESDSTAVKSRGGALSFDTFRLSLTARGRKLVMENREKLNDALCAIFGEQVDNDPLNGLVLTAGMTWQQVDILRSYVHYQRQLQTGFPSDQLTEILLSHPKTCAALIAYFESKFSPEVSSEAEMKKAYKKVERAIRAMKTHNEDRVFSGLFNLIQATLRTNAYRTDKVSHYLSFKFSCADVAEMKGQRPLYEIYVHSRDVEGVHLRFGKVARGGLRWSDRADYRTEVLGLVTTQQVKNVVIVPEGSKGGFFLRQPLADRGARRQQADALYQIFIRGLLDLTDNVVEGEVVHPPRVVMHDEADPYLVVAADKGTAHLSDTANGLSIAYGFWLGDAFASGGSNGYDHKGVGITARGAWVLVRRHFAEMGRDPYSEPFTTVGVGDMGGDVFGNGLIETPHAKLRAAFNHMHIFLDPDPDPASSFEERKRLFEVAGREAGWDHYNPKVLSEGGGVFDRTAKSIPLSPQVREMLGIDAEEADPNEVMRAILCMDVDLFWSGGIGTYVKASSETHADADDRGNDGIRISATELRASVVGEGANLSFTQRGRIEADQCGVRLNTDFIDNSAGVDMSDHEVNLKILLGAPQGRGELDEAQRNALLAKLTEEVAGLVLFNNDAQGRQISRDRIRSQQDIFPFARAISFVERHFNRTRDSLKLPTDEVLASRSANGEGLTRPELATLSSHVKRYVFAELVASGQAKNLRGYSDFLVNYFPKEIQERFPTDIVEHQLADEIAMTMATTQVVADAGAAFLPMVVESTGQGVFEVVDAYLRAQSLAGAYEVRSTLEELRTSVSLAALYKAWVQVDAGARDVTAFWLSPSSRVPRDEELVEMREAAEQVYALQADDVVKQNSEIVARMMADDIPGEVAQLILKAKYLNIALMVWAFANKLDLTFREAVIRQLAAGTASRLQEIIDQLNQRKAEGKWEPIAIEIMVQRFTRMLRKVVISLGTSVEADSVDQLSPVLEQGLLADVRAQVDEMVPAGEEPDLPTLLVLEERLAGAVGRLGS